MKLAEAGEVEERLERVRLSEVRWLVVLGVLMAEAREHFAKGD